MKQTLLFMQKLLYKIIFRRILIIIFILLISKINTYALENTFSKVKGIYLGPYTLRYNPTIYFEENQIGINTDLFGDIGAFLNGFKGDLALDFHFVKIGLGYRGTFYNIYETGDYFVSVNLITPISGLHIGAGYVVQFLSYNSIVDLSGTEYTFDQSVVDIVYSINYRNDSTSISFILSGITPMINSEEIFDRELPPLEITISYLSTGSIPNFKMLIEAVTIHQRADFLSKFNLSLMGVYDYNQNFSFLSGLNFFNGHEGINLGVGTVYSYNKNIYFSYGYRLAFALSYIGNHELSFIYKTGWNKGLVNGLESMIHSIYDFFSLSSSSSSSSEEKEIGSDDDELLGKDDGEFF